MIAVIGAGAMGAALGVHLARAGRQPMILATAYDGPFVEAYRTGAPHPALGVPFPEGTDLVEHGGWAGPLGDAEMVVVAVATVGLVATVREAAPQARGDALWVVATKGWDGETLRSAATVVADELGDPRRVIAFVGPSLAGEVARGVPTGIVCACEDAAAARRVAETFSSETLCAYTSTDVAGVEVGAALKNVVAIAVGMCDGLTGAFDAEALTNTKAFIFSRGLVEMGRLSRALGGKRGTVLGLAGAGDLFVTCLGGRNGRFGRLVGEGRTPEAALEEMKTTVEGYANGRAAVALAKRAGLDLPLLRTVAEVLYEGLEPKAAVARLAGASVEEEFPD